MCSRVHLMKVNSKMDLEKHYFRFKFCINPFARIFCNLSIKNNNLQLYKNINSAKCQTTLVFLLKDINVKSLTLPCLTCHNRIISVLLNNSLLLIRMCRILPGWCLHCISVKTILYSSNSFVIVT